MKKAILVILALITLTAFANASVLQNANTLGAGKMGWLIAVEYDNNLGGVSETLTGVGGYLAYGVMDKLDIFGKVGYGTVSNLPLGVNSANSIVVGVVAKYQLLEESKNMPVAVAAVAGYQAVTGNFSTPLGSGQTVNGDMGVGAVVSKLMIPWVPYGAVVYHSLPSGGTTDTNLELVVGTQMLLSKTSAVVGEVSLNSYTPSGGTSYSNTQISLAYSAKI